MFDVKILKKTNWVSVILLFWAIPLLFMTERVSLQDFSAYTAPKLHSSLNIQRQSLREEFASLQLTSTKFEYLEFLGRSVSLEKLAQLNAQILKMIPMWSFSGAPLSTPEEQLLDLNGDSLISIHDFLIASWIYRWKNKSKGVQS